MADLRNKIAEAIGVRPDNALKAVDYEVIESALEDGYERKLIEFDSWGDKVIAYLLPPDILNKNSAALINHQHNGERYLGKSEVFGLAGDSLQAFGPVLAEKGFAIIVNGRNCDGKDIESGRGLAIAWAIYER